MKIKVVIFGAAGRMGSRMVSLAIESGQFDIVGAVETGNHPDIGKDIGLLTMSEQIGVMLQDKPPKSAADVVIDFSLPDAMSMVIDYCLEYKIAFVSGTTGLSDKQRDKLIAASEQIPIVYATNMSVGMNVLFSLVGKVASMLGDEYDIEIVEQHHRFKKDAPSGTALTLAENICNATGRDFPGSVSNGRYGKEALRKKGDVNVHSVRAGDITGIHSIIYGTPGETITLNHTANSRDTFIRGALRAAKWIVGRDPSLYSMKDVLSIKE